MMVTMLRFPLFFSIFASVLVGLTISHVIPHIGNTTSGRNKLLRRQGGNDPTKFNWVKSFAAIGDSYTAGIGSGAHLGSVWHRDDNWACSRYDKSYPMIINKYLGSDVDKFQYPACSGHKSWEIYEQAQSLEDDIDLLMLTAGGNDLCLVDIIKDCILLSFYGEATCDTIINKAVENLQLILHDNIKEILLALKPKMATDGVVVVNSYARFFNTDNRDCSENQDWSFLGWVISVWLQLDFPLTLTIARRKRFNDLTKALNDLIHEVVNDVRDEVDYKIGFSNWDLWGIEGVSGQMCDPSSTGAYPDPEQPDLLFFKPDTRKSPFRVWPLGQHTKRGLDMLEIPPDEHLKTDPDSKKLEDLRSHFFKPRDLDERGVDRSVYKSSLWNSVNPRAAALKKLNPRAPLPPGCPGDSNSPLPGLGDFMPDFFGRLFHPNELGHTAIASFAIETTMNLRAEVLGVDPKVCKVTEEFKCWQEEGRKGYATADRLDENYKDFCESVEDPDDGTGWKFTKSYHKSTPDEHEFVYEMEDEGEGFSKTGCLESFKRIIHGCDGGDPENPMNWKFGGTWKRDHDIYTINIKRNNRPWPLKSPYGRCVGKNNGDHSAYAIFGAGWASWDKGRESILPAARGCLGLGVGYWTFYYLDKPDEDGYEWYLGFTTPVFVNNRCFKNNKVAFAAKGFTDGCEGNGWA